MFTGIIIGTAKVAPRDARGGMFVINDVPGKLPPIGGSIAVNGVCLTVVKKQGKKLMMDVMDETWKRTALGDLLPGSEVNIEYPMTIQQTVDGHLVQGHVDTTAELLKITAKADSWVLKFGLQTPTPYLIQKGSVAIDGTSLTAVDVGQKSFTVHIIPHTYTTTRFHALQVGSRVNIEFDMLAKHLYQFSLPYVTRRVRHRAP